MRINKAMILATLFLGGTSLTWASENLGDDVNVKQKTPSRVKGFKPTSDHTREVLKGMSKQRASIAGKPKPPAVLPPKVDLRPFAKVVNQGQLGSCTGNAICGGFYIRQVIEYVATDKKHHKLEDVKQQVPYGSRLFVYYNERVMEGTVKEDAGASIGDGILSIYKQGVAKESTWPYSDDTAGSSPLFTKKPSAKAYIEALSNKDLDGVTGDEIKTDKVGFLNKVKAALALNQPLVMGISVWESFESDAVAKTGIVPLPNMATEEYMGGHAVLAVGYDDEKKHVTFLNSWGEDWGDKGYFHLPYEWFALEKNNNADWQKNLTSECWQIGTVTMAPVKLKMAMADHLPHGDANHGGNNNNNDKTGH